ncbi:16678_t:CDS:2, partial [Racocetra fulgida]
MKYTYIALNLLLFSLLLQNNLIVYAKSPIYSEVAQLFEIPESKFQKIADNEKPLTEGYNRLIPLLDKSSFCGSYLDLNGIQIIVYVVDTSKKQIITDNKEMKPYLKFLSFKQVKNSLEKLDSNVDELTKLAKQYKATNIAINKECEKNNIAISLNKNFRKLNKAFIEKAKELDPTPIIIEYDDEPKSHKPNPHNPSTLESRDIKTEILGGIGLTDAKVTGETERTYYLTYLVTSGDCGRKKRKNTTEPVDFYYVPWNEFNFDLPEGYIIGPMIQVFIGLRVCISGFRAGFTCGFIKDNNVVAFIDGVRYDNMIITDLIGNFGDVGAPIFSVPNLLTFVFGPPRVYLVGMALAVATKGYNIVTPMHKVLKED